MSALLYVDLDGFKPVNDTHGHEVGDMLLKQVAARLVAVTRETDMVARLGGDEFALLLEDVDAARGARSAAEKVIATLSEPFAIEALDTPVTIGASVGIATFGGAEGSDEAFLDIEAIVRRADDAMYDAKLAGKGTWRLAAALVS